MNNRPPVIGIVGRIGAGKTTAQSHLETRGYTSYNMAQPLKAVALCLGFKYKECYGTQEQKLAINEQWGISGRRFLQLFGTDVCRKLLPKKIPEMHSVWIQCFENYAKANDGPIVIGDIRFPDEAESIRKLGGILIRIERNTNHSGEQTQHASELEQNEIKVNHIIDNNGSLHSLTQKLDAIIGYEEPTKEGIDPLLITVIVALGLGALAKIYRR